MIHFKQAETQHAQDINLLVNSAYRGDSSKVGWTTEADLLGGQRTDLEKIKEMIEGETSRIEMALDENNALLGCVYLEHEQDCLYLGMLTVNPALQAQGIGKLLMIRSEEIAREAGLSKIRMTVISLRTELIAFYQRRGFTASGKTEPFPEDDPRFGLPKTKGMVFQEFIKVL
jgi:N-acetylglutamate synthase-like GNAT family acetyltransferase